MNDVRYGERRAYPFMNETAFADSPSLSLPSALSFSLSLSLSQILTHALHCIGVATKKHQQCLTLASLWKKYQLHRGLYHTCLLCTQPNIRGAEIKVKHVSKVVFTTTLLLKKIRVQLRISKGLDT